MNDDAPISKCVIDCAGLHEIASTKSNNLKSLYLDQLKCGVIAVPACVWKEFQEIYDDEALSLAPYIANKINLKNAYYKGAARIADKLNSGFPRGAYNRQTDLYTASIASIEECRVLTTSAQQKVYEEMGCEVQDLVTWADEFGSN